MGSKATFNFKGGKKTFDVSKKIEKAKDEKAVYAKVGFPKSSGATYPNGVLIAKVAAWNEYGTKKSPARPFMAITKKEKTPQVNYFYKRMMKDALNNPYKLSSSMEMLAKKYKSWIQETITKLDDPPNAPSTIARKKSSNPLIDTSIMRKAVSYEIMRSK